ncbi:MAG: DUF3048 domain-containing protein [Defluviitaleaceae bacterium]|nr:DUF3048 domain-containing protein [Defluviitaleaceae bacterium]
MKKLILLMFLVACSTNESEFFEAEEITYEVSSVDEIIELEETRKPKEERIKTINPLTGIYHEGEHSFYPIAVVINNIPAALPQSGISEADIIYEVLAEGGITRLIAIFTSSKAEKIGPIRSTREYFADIATNWNAPIVHHGGSPGGYNRIRQLGITSVDGFHLENRYFWRVSGRPREHSSYTNWDNIIDFLGENFGKTAYWQGVHFSAEPQEKNEITEVTISFSHAHEVHFILENDTFRRYQRGESHIDEYTGEQMQVHNLIIKRASHSPIPNDPEGRININLTGSGVGYLITKYGYTEITWTNTESGFVWQDQDGNDITLIPGNTWISIIGQNQNVTFKGEE